MQEGFADAPVEAHPLGDLLHIRSDLFAKRCDLVDEGDLHGEKRVGCVFDHFGRFEIRDDDREIAQ